MYVEVYIGKRDVVIKQRAMPKGLKFALLTSNK